MTIEGATVNERLKGIVVVTCPRHCGATIKASVVCYTLDVRAESQGSEIPIKAPDLPAALLLHWIDCPNALVDPE